MSRFQKQKYTPGDVQVREAYLKYFEHKKPGKTPLREVSFVVLDTETTGLEILKDSILSIACLCIKNFEIDLSNRLELFFQRPGYQPGKSVQIHGILSRHVKEGVAEQDALVKILEYVKNHIIVGHHISFDIHMINQALQKHFGFKLKNKLIDTAHLAQRVENPMVKEGIPKSLEDLCLEYNVPLGQRHTAAGDTFITALLFLKLLGKLESKKVDTLWDLL